MKLSKSVSALNRALKRFFGDLKFFGVGHAFYGFLWDIFQHFNFYGKLTNYFFQKREKSVHEFIEHNFKDLIDKYDNLINEKKFYGDDVSEDFKIWMFWGQGITSAPDLVKICYEQACKCDPGRVNLVTFDNIHQYVKIPDVIFDKLKNGKISMIHFSDILRMALLAEYGGLWIDATCFMTQKIPAEWLGAELLTVKQKHFQYHLGDCWLMGSCKKDMFLFKFIRDIWFEYVQEQDAIIDYFFTNHMFTFCYKRYSDFRKIWGKAPFSSNNKIRLIDVFNNEFDEDIWRNIMDSSIIYKLSYKGNFVNYKRGKRTFYKYFCSLK